jgi:hypothetical protein
MICKLRPFGSTLPIINDLALDQNYRRKRCWKFIVVHTLLNTYITQLAIAIERSSGGEGESRPSPMIPGVDSCFRDDGQISRPGFD